MVKVQVNSQGKVLTTGGKALVASDGSKYGATVNSLLGNVDENGVLQFPTEQSELVFEGVKDVAEGAFQYKFAHTGVKSVSFPTLTTISGSTGCSNMFNGCTSLTSVSLPTLTTISGGNGCYGMFYGCTALTSVSLPALTTISSSTGCNNMFYGCTALTDVYFSALKTTSFGTAAKKNQFQNMMSSTRNITTHTLHFPSNLESTISTLTGYPLFGGTSGYVVCAFDLPATE